MHEPAICQALVFTSRSPLFIGVHHSLSVAHCFDAVMILPPLLSKTPT